MSVVVRQGKFWNAVKREGGVGEAFVYDADMKKRLRGIINHLTTCAGGFGAAFEVRFFACTSGPNDARREDARRRSCE